VPEFTPGRVFASVKGSTLRDPTTAVFDPITSTWHVYCTFVKGKVGAGGYPGVVWHWSLSNASSFDDPRGVWTSEGAALNASGVDGDWDASGVFTPGIIRECDNTTTATATTTSTVRSVKCRWFLFFGGVPSQSNDHPENVGVAVAASPWGPFVRWGGNPVFSRFDTNARWCDGGPAARVDEIKPAVINGVK
jgi:hypothetical protein